MFGLFKTKPKKEKNEKIPFPTKYDGTYTTYGDNADDITWSIIISNGRYKMVGDTYDYEPEETKGNIYLLGNEIILEHESFFDIDEIEITPLGFFHNGCICETRHNITKQEYRMLDFDSSISHKYVPTYYSIVGDTISQKTLVMFKNTENGVKKLTKKSDVEEYNHTGHVEFVNDKILAYFPNTQNPYVFFCDKDNSFVYEVSLIREDMVSNILKR